MNGPNKLECYITLGRKGLTGKKHSSILNLFVSYKDFKVLRIKVICSKVMAPFKAKWKPA